MVYTKRAAMRDGYTHEGFIYGIPVWVKVEESEIAIGCADVVEVACKFMPLELFLPIADWVYMGGNRLMYPQHGIAWPLLVKEQPL